MIYVFDTSSFIILFKHYYPTRFPSLWKNFEAIIKKKRVISVREVKNEINNYADFDRLVEWANSNNEIFPAPATAELFFVKDLFNIRHYQQLLRQKETMQGNPVADPFVIAKAKICKGAVVTQECYKENSAKIPNVCDYFNIPCLNLEKFMEDENWKF